MEPNIDVTETLSESGRIRICRGYRVAGGERVILKIVDRGAREEDLARCRQEFAILSRTRIPGVVKAYALEEIHDGLVLLLEDIGGTSLDRLSPAGALPLDQFLDLAIGLAGALSGLHHLRIVHNAIQPAHIVRKPGNGEFRLIGFSRAAELPRLTAALEAPAALEGALEYISPEQTGRMNRLVDYRTDFYSLGITFYQLLAGRLPFVAQDALGLVHCHIAGVPVPPHEHNPAIPEALSRIVLKLMAKMPEDRYQSAAGLRADLERCRRELHEGGSIPPFDLGLADTPGRLRHPARLHGRDAETHRLHEAFERVRGGACELLLVAGYSGVGKTTFVHQLQKAVLERKGCFIEGKFDQLQRNTPNFGWIPAVTGLVNHLVQADEVELEYWKHSILGAVGGIGAVLTEAFPNLKLVVGSQPPVPALGPAEAQNRFKHAFVQLIRAVATREHPLVVFLDDLQWIDAASLNLLEALPAAAGDSSLLLIGAYRENEVDPAHPLAQALARLGEQVARVERLSLNDLSQSSVNELLADALDCEPRRTEPLAALLYAKTGGNPFFVLQALGSLVDRQALIFDGGQGRWQWDLAAFESVGIAANVVSLMLGRIRQLPAGTQDLLSLAACVGFRFDIAQLGTVAGQSEEAVLRTLEPAIEEGSIMAAGPRYQFAHDRVREAAYAVIPSAERPAQHLRIGRILLAQSTPNAPPENIFDVVGHCNAGMALIAEEGERRRLAELNLIAGRRAKSSAAFSLACSHFAAGTALLVPDAWEKDYDLACCLLLEHAESAYLAGDYETSGGLLAQALDRVRGLLDRATVYRLRQRLYQLSGRFHDALSVALEACELFGVVFPDTDEAILSATEAEIAQVRKNLGGRAIAELGEVPASDDAATCALIGLLAEALPMVYTARPVLWPLMTATGVNLCLERGHAGESPFVYSCYAMVMVGICRDIPAASQFSEMALRLCDRLPGAAAWRGKLLFHDAVVIGIWGRPFAANLPLMEQAFQVCLDDGDLVAAGYLTYNAIWLHLENGASLGHVIELARHYVEFARQNHNLVVYNVDRVEEQFALCLQGKTRSDTDFSDASFDEAVCVAAITQSGFGLGIARHHIMKLIAAYLAGEFDEAFTWAGRTAPILLQVASTANEATYHFYRALTVAALYGQETPQRQREFLEVIRDASDKLEFWQQHCPANFAGRHALLQAEIARLEGRSHDAMNWYERAIAKAGENGFVHIEALAYELASDFYRQWGYTKFADTYLAEAAAGYSRWGAVGKVRRLERRFPWLARTRHAADSGTLVERLDAVSVAKAQQAISGEILMDRLARTLLQIVMENAGAQTGCLVLEGGGELRAAMGHGEDSASHVVFDTSPPGASVPATILNYVRRTRATVDLADAGLDGGGFASDEYLSHTRPKSVLCMPIQRKDTLLGILYLENNLVSGAFTPARRVVLEALASQAAISLETAGVYEALRDSEAKYRRIVDTANEGICVVGADGRTSFVNARMAGMLGYTVEEMLGRQLSDFMFEEDVADRQLKLEHRHAGIREHYERRFRRNDGQAVWTLAAGTPILEDQHRFLGSIGMFTDITERKRNDAVNVSRLHLIQFAQAHSLPEVLEEALNEIEKLTGSRIGFWHTVDRDQNTLVLQNWSTATASGVCRVAEPRLHHAISEAGVWAECVRRAEPVIHNDVPSIAGRKGTPEGHPALVREVVVPLLREGRIAAVLGVGNKPSDYTARDAEVVSLIADLAWEIAERKMADEERAKLRQHLQQAQKMQAVGQLAGGIAHDFNNLLAVVNGYSELILAKRGVDESTRSQIREVLKAGNRAAALTRQLLAFSRSQVLQPKQLNLNQIIGDIRKMLGRLIGEDIEIKYLLDPWLEPLLADPSQIEQVILNFAINARDAMPNGGTLTIETSNMNLDEMQVGQRNPLKPGRYVRLSVTDTGIGMDTETLAHIFEPFFTTKGPDRGTGLGLATVYGIVTQSGGHVTVYSEPGHGTTFSSYLPAAAPAASAGEKEGDAAARDLRGTETILLVEDLAPLRLLTRTLLERAGYTLLEAEDGQQAVEVARGREDQIALLVTDVVLPKLNGPSVAKALQERHPRMKVLYISGYADHAAIHKGNMESGSAFLQKPFSAEDLTAKVRELLDERGAA